MKKTFAILFTIIFVSIFAFGQDNNKKLYEAIKSKDTLLVKEMLKDKADPNCDPTS
jgi:hypothetical protein